MAGFVARLDEINALADRSPGFVWRLQTSEGNATYLRPYDDDRILFNMSVWESIEPLSGTSTAPRTSSCCGSGRRGSKSSPAPTPALWWVPRGHVPGIDEAKKRLAHLEANGPTPFAFTFKNPFPPDRAVRGKHGLVLVRAVPRGGHLSGPAPVAFRTARHLWPSGRRRRGSGRRSRPPRRSRR